MNPSTHDRLASVVRALECVILPALPAEASLAREQAMLAIGHLQITLAQLDALPAFEAEELADIRRMASAAANLARGGAQTGAALAAMAALVDAQSSDPARIQLAAMQDAIDTLLLALAQDGDPAARAAVSAEVLRHGALRADKDRRWFAVMGFDAEYA